MCVWLIRRRRDVGEQTTQMWDRLDFALAVADAIRGAIMIARWNFLPVLIDFVMHNQSVELG